MLTFLDTCPAGCAIDDGDRTSDATTMLTTDGVRFGVAPANRSIGCALCRRNRRRHFIRLMIRATSFNIICERCDDGVDAGQ